jgi:two-component system response regulator DevR
MADAPDDRRKVVLVDDHRSFSDALGRLLADEPDIEIVGYAATGQAAIAMANGARPDVMLVDFDLPDRDGVSVAAEVKATLPAIMVVMLTGSTDDRILVQAIEAGCSGFITKDRPAREIADGIRAAAAGEALISPAALGRLLPKLSRTYHAAGSDLTDREKQILAMIAQGANNQHIASELFLSIHTIRNYTQSILSKLATHSKLEAVSVAVREGIISFAHAS